MPENQTDVSSTIISNQTLHHLKQQFSNLWLAATNPKKLTRQYIDQESISLRCEQLSKYLEPMFLNPKSIYGGLATIAIDPSLSSSSSSSLKSLSSSSLVINESNPTCSSIPQIHAQSNQMMSKALEDKRYDGVTFRLNLYMAVQMLLGVHVVFLRKVELVQKNLAALLREFKIFLNLTKPNLQSITRATMMNNNINFKDEQHKSKSKKLIVDNIDELIKKKLDPIVRSGGHSPCHQNETMFEVSKRGFQSSEILNEYNDDDINNYIDNYFQYPKSNQEILENIEALANNQILEFGTDFNLNEIEKDIHCNLMSINDEMVDFGIQNTKNDGSPPMIAMDGLDWQNSRLEKTPCSDPNKSKENHFLRNDFTKYDQYVNYDNIKQKRLDYEATMHDDDQKTDRKVNKRRQVKIDSSISISSATIRACLASTDDIQNCRIKSKEMIYKKIQIFYKENQNIQSFVERLKIYLLSSFDDDIKPKDDSNMKKSFKNISEVFELRDSKNQSSSLANLLDYNATATKFNSSNSESTLQLRNNSQDSPNLLEYTRRNSDNDYITTINNIPGLNFEDIPDENNMIFKNDKEKAYFDIDYFKDANDKGFETFQNLYPPAKTSRLKASDAFHILLNKISREELEARQNEPLGNIFLKVK